MSTNVKFMTLYYEPTSSGKTHFIAEGYSLRDLFKSDGFSGFLAIVDTFELCKLMVHYKGPNGYDVNICVQEYCYGYPVTPGFYSIASKN